MILQNILLMAFSNHLNDSSAILQETDAGRNMDISIESEGETKVLPL